MDSEHSIKQVETDRTSHFDAVLAEYLEAVESGTAPSRQELLARYPDLADELREFFVNGDRMETLFRHSAGADTVRIHIEENNGRRFGNYELLEEIARGGMGIVYKARQIGLNRTVALKMIRESHVSSAEDKRRFRAEAELAANLQHPNIVAIYDVGERDGQPYFSMDYVEGSSLANLVAENPLPPKQAAGYLQSVAGAIHYAHTHEVLHRDLKPSNILVDTTQRVRITDFGLARRLNHDSSLTCTGQLLGTPSYMSPEQAAGKHEIVGPASDIYSLGVVLYELLTGRPPFRAANPLDTLLQIKQAEPVAPHLLNPNVPSDLETICLTCLEKEPHKRYGTAQLLADDLGRYLRGDPIAARPIRPWHRGVKWVRRHPTVAGLAAMSALALLAIVGLIVGRVYNARLKTLNDQLATANTSAENRSNELTTTNNALGKTSNKLARALDDVKAERARARRYLYAATMALIQRAEQENQPARVVQLLRSVIPESPGQEDLRDFEWNHLWRKYVGEQLHVRGHASAVTALAFSPNAEWIASGCDDGTVKLRDSASGRELHTLVGHAKRITGLAFSPDGARLVSASTDQSLKLWNAKTGEEIRSFIGHVQPLTAVAYSSDGQLIASGSEDGQVLLWEASTGRNRAELSKNTNSIRGLAFDAKGHSVAIASSETFVIWAPLAEMTTTESPFVSTTTNISFNSEITFAVSARNPDNKLILRQRKIEPEKSVVSTWDCRQSESSHSIEVLGTIIAVAYSPAGTTIAGAIRHENDNVVRVWDAKTGSELYAHHDQSAIRSIVFDSSGLRIAAGTDDGTVILWSLPGRETRTIHDGQARASCVSFGAGGELLGACYFEATIVWDVMTGKQVSRKPGGQYRRIALSPTSAVLAGAPPASLEDVRTGRSHSLASWSGGGLGPYGYAFSNDGSLVAEATGSRHINVWETEGGTRIRQFGLENYTASVAFSPDNKRLAAGSGSGAMAVWEIDSGRPVLPAQALPLGIWELAFSPDGKLLAAAMGLYGEHSPDTNAVRVWNTSTWEVLYDLHGHSECVWSVRFSPSGNRLASASASYSGPRRATGPKSSPADSETLKSVTPLGEVKLWDMSTGQEMLTIYDDKQGMFGVAFSPDGRHLATAGATGLVKLLDGGPLAATPAYEPLPVEWPGN